MEKAEQGKEFTLGKRDVTMDYLTKDERYIINYYRHSTRNGKSFIYDTAFACWEQGVQKAMEEQQERKQAQEREKERPRLYFVK